MNLNRKIFFSFIFSLASLGLSAQFLSVVTSSTNVSCFNGSDGTGTVESVSGGIPPYTYQWLYNDLTPIVDSTNSTISGLPAGFYFVQVYDSSVPVKKTGLEIISILNGPNIAILVFSTDVVCNGEDNGSIQVSAFGGNPPLEYSINGGADYQSSNTFTDLAPGSYNVVVRDSKGCTKAYGSNPVAITEPDALTTSLFDKTDINCYGANNGAIDATISGGVPPYDISWSNGETTEDISSLPPGPYTLTVTDANLCESVLGPITIIEPPQIIINNVVSTPETCFNAGDGTVTVTAGGGTGDLQYTLTPLAGPPIIRTDGNFTGLSGSTYSLSITDDNGCGPVVQGGIVVNNPPVLGIGSEDTTNITCNGADNGMIMVSGTGGTPPYTYTLNPGATTDPSGTFTGLAPGIPYTVDISDVNGCPPATSGPWTFAEPAAITISLDDTSNVTCNGYGDGTITVSAAGGSGTYVYTLTPGPVVQANGNFTSLDGGTYSVSVTDSKGCTPAVVGGIVITDPDPVSIDNIDITDILCFGDDNGIIDVSASGGTGTRWYTLNPPGPPAQNNGTFGGLGPAIYDISVTDDNGCPAATAANLEVIEPAVIAITDQDTVPISCNGFNDGSIVITATGGTAPLDFTLNPPGTKEPSGVFTGLGPNPAYQVTVTDANGCPQQLSNSWDFVEPAAITLAGVDTNDVTCNSAGDGSLSVIAGGGTAPYIYTLTPGAVSQDTGYFQNLAGDTYSVSVTDSRSCPPASVNNMVITDPAPISISNIVTTDVTCNGADNGTVIVTASGGTGLLEYTLTPGTGPALNNNDGNFTGLPGEIYSLSITDKNTCTPATASNLVVNEPPALSIDLEDTTGINCFGANDARIQITASGGTGNLTYTLYDPGVVAVNQTGMFVGLGPGPYAVGVDDDNGCGPIFSNSFTFTDPAALAVTVDGSSSKTLACFGDSTGSLNISVTGGFTPYNYSWTGPNAYTNNIEDISGLKAGDYNLTLTDARGCILDSIPLDSITGPTQLTMSIARTDVSCFGNADGAVTITSGGGTAPYDYSRNGFVWQGSDTFSPLNPGPYTFYTRDDKGCITSLKDTIQQPQEIKINTVNEDNTGQKCSGDSNGIITIIAIGGTGMLEYSIDTGTTYFPNNVFAGLGGGSYKVSVRDANGCSVSAGGTYRIQNPDLLYIDTLIQQDITSCSTSPEGIIFIEGGGGSPPMQYILNAADTSLTGLFENLSQGPHDLEVMDAKGCVKDTSVFITAPPPIIVSTLITHVTTCPDDSTGAIAVVASGGTGQSKGFVYLADTTFSNDTAFYNNLPGGSYDFTVFDSLGCEAFPSAVINAPDSIRADSALAFPVTCFGNTDGEIRVYGAGGTMPYSYILSPLADTNATGIFTNLVSGDYTVSIEDFNGCQPYVTSTLTVIEPPPLVIDSSSSTVISCGGFSDGTITVYASGGLPPYAYSANDGTSFGPDPLISGLGPGTHIIYLRDSAGCSIPGDTIVFSDPPGLSLDPSTVTDVALCAGDSTGAISVSAAGGTGALEYSLDSATWQSAGDFTNLPAGIYVPVVRDSKSCILAFPADTINEPPPISTVITTTTAMIPNPGTISISASGGTPPFEYSVDSGASYSTNTFFAVSSDLYGVVVRDANGCTYEETVYVPATPPLVVDVSYFHIDCNDNNNGTITLSPQNGIGRVIYSIEGGFNPELTGNFTNLAGGTYFIHVQDSHRVYRDTVTIINPPPFGLTTTVVPASCSRNSFDGSISLSVAGATPPYTYLWSNGDSTKDISGLEGMDYSLEITDAYQCLYETVITVPAQTTLIADAGPDTVACYGDEVTLNGTGGDEFNWSPEEGLDNPYVSNPVALVTDSIFYVLFTRDQLSGCADRDTVLLSTHTGRGISAGQDTTVAPGQSITLTATGGPFSIYLWEPSDGLGNPNSQSTIATISTDISYMVTGTTEFGCEESDSMNVSIATGLTIYTGFSPNDDGFNDFWDIDDIIFYPNATVKVFDRWGKTVFSSVGYADNQRWDGKYKGKDLPTGTYYYVIELKDGSEPYKGPVTIVR